MGTIDLSSMLGGFAEWLDWNEIDAMWVARITKTFRAAGGNGTIKTLPDAAIHASLKAAGLLGGRRSVTFDDPIAYGMPPTTGYTNDPGRSSSSCAMPAASTRAWNGTMSGSARCDARTGAACPPPTTSRAA